jgi:nitroimidazol reductase NimA-like FMN-containing flavoprotein (pyridoxamine 5'-phosphate oxidase superfamily)
MYGELTQSQIEKVLYAGSIGRIGFQMDGKVYIIPINYAYDGENIYANTLDGSKVQIMRTHPNVCFQVDQIEDSSHWRSVLIWGTFEELTGDEAANALHQLTQQFMTLIASGHPLHKLTRGADGQLIQPHPDIIVYRIHITEKIGRYEQD